MLRCTLAARAASSSFFRSSFSFAAFASAFWTYAVQLGKIECRELSEPPIRDPNVRSEFQIAQYTQVLAWRW